MPNRTAMYPGTFDGLTYGHVNLIERCSRLYERLIVAVANNPQKKPMFTLEERLDMIREAVKEWPNVEVDHFSGLTVHYARQQGIHCVIRGLRAVTDFEWELQMALMNQQLDDDVETVFMAPGLNWVFVSSTLIKEIVANGGDVSAMVPPHVEKALCAKLKG